MTAESWDIYFGLLSHSKVFSNNMTPPVCQGLYTVYTLHQQRNPSSDFKIFAWTSAAAVVKWVWDVNISEMAPVCHEMLLKACEMSSLALTFFSRLTFNTFDAEIENLQIPGVNGVVVFSTVCTFSHEQAAVVKLWAVCFVFLCISTRRIPNQTCDCTSLSLQLVCSSSSVSPPRLVPRAETSNRETCRLHPTALLLPDVEDQPMLGEEEDGGTSVLTPHTVKRWNSPDVETWAPLLYLPTACWATTRPTVCFFSPLKTWFYFILKKSPLRFLNLSKQQVRRTTFHQSDQNADVFMKRKVHARVISDSKTFL